MRKLLNTLYITNDDVFLKLDGENVVASIGRQELARVPFCNIENIVCFNYMGCSPALMAKCAEKNVGLSFLSPQGKFLGRLSSGIRGNVHLRREQFRKAEDEQINLYLAKCSIRAKIQNSRNFLMKERREHPNLLAYLEGTIDSLDNNLDKVGLSENLDELRGYEGSSAKDYFDVFGYLVRNDAFCFNGRSKRPPLDNVNAMLSYLYALLALDCQSALETVGLDPYIGYFHTDRSGRASLALDLMEEFRCYMVDRCVLSLINLRQINPSYFETEENGAILLTEEGRKIILKAWQERKKEEIKHPIINEKVQVGLLPYVQARLLAKFYRNEMNEYKPFVVKL